MDGTPKGIAKLIQAVEGSPLSPASKEVFARCILNTWQTTIQQREDGSYFVITGDIPAMWLRDSSMQVFPYLRVADDPQLAQMFRGIIRKQADYIAIDPYANAFNAQPDSSCWDKGDRTDSTTPWNWERKYELDSVCFPLFMAGKYARNTGDWEVFDQRCRIAYLRILTLMETEQHHEEQSAYRFERDWDQETETLQRQGKGRPVGYTGMVWSGFRPSDDACTYGYLVPANMLACAALQSLLEINDHCWQDSQLAARAQKLLDDIRQGIAQYAVVERDGKKLYAYEVDGLGNQLLMDDANYPSLLSAPFLDFCQKDDPIYQNTRDFVLSTGNPFFFSGTAASGIGSPHTPDQYIWHLGLAMQGLTSADTHQRRALLATLLATDGGTGYMHEGFHKDDPTHFTRPWFSWANSMFCALVLDMLDQGELEG